MRRLLVAAGVSWGCSFNPASYSATGDGGAGAADVRVEPAVDGCASSCLNDDTLIECDGSMASCAYGCFDGNPTSPAHCGAIEPANDVPLDLLGGSLPAFTVASDELWIIDTTNGTITGCESGAVIAAPFQVVQPGGEVGVGVFALSSLLVERDGRLRAIGVNALALLVEGDVTIRGVIDASGGGDACDFETACDGDVEGNRRCAGPGGGTGGGPGGDGGLVGGGTGGFGGSPGQERGGGGGGFGESGGDGGGQGGVAGDAFGSLDPISGGGGGGGGGLDGDGGEAGWGGGGGGAVQITSLTQIAIRPMGGDPAGIRTGGAGGGFATQSNGAGGGGAGGGILLEAPVITVDAGRLTANGGGGGGGPGSGVSGGEGAGTTGLFTTDQAPGGAGDYTGGYGGSSIYPPGGPGNPSTVADGASGGGGGVGRIELRAWMGQITLMGGATISPAATQASIRIE